MQALVQTSRDERVVADQAAPEFRGLAAAQSALPEYEQCIDARGQSKNKVCPSVGRVWSMLTLP